MVIAAGISLLIVSEPDSYPASSRLRVACANLEKCYRTILFLQQFLDIPAFEWTTLSLAPFAQKKCTPDERETPIRSSQ